MSMAMTRPRPSAVLLGRAPLPADLLLIDRDASVQFAGMKALIFRVTRVDDRPTYDGWIWMRGYALNGQGEAADQRDIFVQTAGLKKVR